MGDVNAPLSRPPRKRGGYIDVPSWAWGGQGRGTALKNGNRSNGLGPYRWC
jgi:hypothetical protein